MTKFINVRGTNGSGKTTLLRNLALDYGVVQVKHVTAQRQPKGVPITVLNMGCALVGDYSANAKGTTAGLDRIKTQAGAKEAIVNAAGLDNVSIVLFEGILVSTIYTPWRDWSQSIGGMIWAYLDTPIDVCIKRVQERNGGKSVKDDLIKSKYTTIDRTMAKAKLDGERTETLDYRQPLNDLRRLISEY